MGTKAKRMNKVKEEQTAEEVVEAGDDLWDLLAEYTTMC
jgi:hypothetical protein